MISNIKITSLTNIGANLSYTSVFPVVDLAGTATTKKANLQIIGNAILSGAGGSYFVPAAQANIALSVANAAQPNITSVGTLTSLVVAGDLTADNIAASNIIAPVEGLNLSGGVNGYVLQTDGTGNLSWTAQTGGGGGNGVPGGANTQIQFNNAGEFGGSASLAWDQANTRLVTANISAAGTITAANFAGNGVRLASISGANVSGQVGYAAVANSVAGANVTGAVGLATYATTANSVAGANVSGQVSNAFVSETVLSSSQPNITSIGTLSSLTVSGNIGASRIVLPDGGLNLSGGVNGYVLQTDGTGNLSWTAQTGGSGGNGVPGGANTQIQFNNAGEFGGSPALTWDNSTNVFATSGNISARNYIGNGARLTSLNGSNVTGIVSIANTAYSVSFANVAGLGNVAGLNLDDDPGNILYGDGTFAIAPVAYTNARVATFLSSFGSNTLITTGNANVGNLNAIGNITGGNLIGTLSNGTTSISMPTYAGNINFTVAGLSSVILSNSGANFSGAISVAGNITGGNLIGTLVNGTSNISLVNNGNIRLTAGGNSTLIVTSTGANITGTANISGNLSAGNINTTLANFTTVNVAGQLISTQATGTSPLLVSSTTLVANLNADLLDGYNTSISSIANTISVRDTSGSIAAAYFIGNGSQLTGISNISNSSSNVSVEANNVRVGVGGTANVLVLSNNSAIITGYANISSNLKVSGSTSLGPVGNVSITGGTSGYVLATNGAGTLSWIPLASSVPGTNSSISNGSSNVNIDFSGNVSTSVSGNANILVVNSTGANVLGSMAAANFILTGAGTPTLTSTTNLDLSATTAVRIIGGGSLRLPSLTNTQISALIGSNGDMVYNSTSNAFQAFQAGNWINIGDLITTQLNTGSNVTLGTVTGNWILSAGSKMQSTGADLAEYYEADATYQPGTVLEFGGEKEVTLANLNTTKVAGVVSTNHGYAMNIDCPGIAIAIALQGRVPCKVIGSISKGDFMVSAGNGFAKSSSDPKLGSIIGKALQNFNGEEGVIEVAVGRL